MTRRAIDTVHNFANKPVFFACNGVQMRRRVSYKAGTKESDRTARNSRNASRLKENFTDGSTEGRRVCLVIDGKRGGEWCTALHPERTTAARLRTVVRGDIGGEREGRSRRKAGRHDEAKRFGVS